MSKFTYSFVTVPTIKRDQFKDTNVRVKRVEKLSGGNYWGYPFRKGIAKNIHGIFSKNFKEAFSPSSQIEVLDENIPFLKTKYNYFNL